MRSAARLAYVRPRLVRTRGNHLGFRFRKSITIANGVRLNVSKGGLGLSAGPRGVRYSVHSSGRRTASAGIPGTGLGVVQTRGRSRAGAAPRRSAPAPPQREGPESAEALPTRKPSLFAPKGDKGLYQAWASNDVSAMRQVSAMFPDYALAADALVGVKAAIANDLPTARELLGRVFASGLDPAAHPFLSTYLPTSRVVVEIATGVSAALPFTRMGSVYCSPRSIRRSGMTKERSTSSSRSSRRPTQRCRWPSCTPRRAGSRTSSN